jgi:hypothetical protein
LNVDAFDRPPSRALDLQHRIPPRRPSVLDQRFTR